MNKILRNAVFRIGLILASLILQLTLWYGITLLLGNYSNLSFVILLLISTLCITYIILKEGYSEVKISWIVFIFLLPVTGVFFYLTFSGQVLIKGRKEINKKINQRLKSQIKPISSFDVDDIVNRQDVKRHIRYLNDIALSPAQINTQTQYYKVGEEFLEPLLDELKKAEKFIFLEYFTIKEGEVWSRIEKVLFDKASKGIEVRVMYDEIGSLFTVDKEFSKKLLKNGVKCEVFNPYANIITAGYNNRDHRKICVIDGNVGFTGGINIADEYFNKFEKHGHWKDTAIKLKGEAVYNLTVMFLAMWESVTKKEENFEKYMPTEKYNSDGIVQPFYDNPYDGNAVGETVYMNILNTACNYVYITTPYLVISREMIVALTTASKSGVDVKIITPQIPDHKIIQFLSRSFYQELIDAGVEIYEYSLGFIHSKMFVSDDETAVVGTINLDYRSLLLHYECGVSIYNNSSIKDIKKDFLDTLNISTQIKDSPIKLTGIKGFFNFLALGILRIFAPLT
ncbi:MAG: cardiolipin synthase [Clostridia bacterium]